MSELRKIEVCQAHTCQAKGSKSVMHRLQSLYEERYTTDYPKLQIQAFDCNGGCEQGPIVRVNDTMTLREFEKEDAAELLEHPEQKIGDVMHVLEKDRETFERIITGELF